MTKRLILALIFPVLLLAIPFALRPSAPIPADDEQSNKLVIVSPHTAMITQEFSQAFERHYYNKYGIKIDVEFRNMGGTSDIVRYIDDRFSAEFRKNCENNGYLWNDESVNIFRYGNPKMELRKRFLDSSIGIGIDLFFGGGVFDHSNMGARGYIVDGGVQKRHPEYFEDIPQSFGGETIYDPAGRFYGTCLATFGICYNPDRLKKLNLPPPQDWHDLADFRYFNTLVVADPTKSGSINKCFENIIQDQMSRLPDNPEQGWANGINLVKAIIANSRYVADAAGKVPQEVAAGNAAAGIAIDFYALSENEYSAANFNHKPKIFYIQPSGLAAVSPDPISMLRGAPNRQAAEEFIDFVLSTEGQKLWNYRPGTPGGPQKYSLRRPPVRSSMFTGEHQAFMTDPNYNPYNIKSVGVYDPARTARYFSLIRIYIKSTMLDVHSELQAAYQAAMNNPAKAEEFAKILIPYSKLPQAVQDLREAPLVTKRKWTLEAMNKYNEIVGAK